MSKHFPFEQSDCMRDGSPRSYNVLERLTRRVLMAAPIGKRPRGRLRTMSRDYISDLNRLRLSLEQGRQPFFTRELLPGYGLMCRAVSLMHTSEIKHLFNSI